MSFQGGTLGCYRGKVKEVFRLLSYVVPNPFAIVLLVRRDAIQLGLVDCASVGNDSDDSIG